MNEMSAKHSINIIYICWAFMSIERVVQGFSTGVPRKTLVLCEKPPGVLTQINIVVNVYPPNVVFNAHWQWLLSVHIDTQYLLCGCSSCELRGQRKEEWREQEHVAEAGGEMLCMAALIADCEEADQRVGAYSYIRLNLAEGEIISALGYPFADHTIAK